MLNLRNLKITDAEVKNRDMVLDGIKELGIVIEDNYDNWIKREIALEFNIGSRLGEPREYLVVYANPDFTKNPYVFILKQTDSGKCLVNETSLESFQDLADLDSRKEINKTLAVAFKNLPDHAFLGTLQIEGARKLAKEFDEMLR